MRAACFQAKPPDNFFFFWVKNRKDSNLRIYRILTPHLPGVIWERGVPHKRVFQIIELYSLKSQSLKEINHVDRQRFSPFSAALRVRTLCQLLGWVTGASGGGGGRGGSQPWVHGPNRLEGLKTQCPGPRSGSFYSASLGGRASTSVE